MEEVLQRKSKYDYNLMKRQFKDQLQVVDYLIENEQNNGR